MYTSTGENPLTSSSVPAFLTKLWTLVEDPSTDDLICWDPVSILDTFSWVTLKDDGSIISLNSPDDRQSNRT